MVIEHTFVTTMQDHEALSSAANLLNARGFVATGDRAFSMDGGWNLIEMTRGKKNPARAKSILQLPQSVRIEFDRGRISMAAVVSPWGRGSREQIPRELRTRSTKNPHPLQQELLLALVQAIELLLVNRQPPQLCIARLDYVEAAIQAYARRLRNRNWTIGITVILLIATAMFLLIYNASTH